MPRSNMKKLWAKIRRSQDDDDEETMAMNNAIAAAIMEEENQPRHGGSRPGRRPNVERMREERGKGLMEDYFVERPVFSEEEFRKRYRMSRDLFNRVSTDICNHDDYFTKKSDAAKKVGFTTQQKMTNVMRMLAYGAGADQCTEYSRMAESTGIQALQRFTRGICQLYGAEYLRAPNPADLRRLLAKADKRGFPGMIGSIDCMHWQWKNCPTAWAGQYSGRKHYPTIILEAVASYDTWIWHAFFGMPGACNDLNVLAKSPLFDEITTGRAPQVRFEVNNRTYNLGYYLADGIYPRWATFVKSVPNPSTAKDILFSTAQEAHRKDVERCFGILQSRFGIVRGAARMWDKEDLRYIMLTCIILHNMIIEDERLEDSDDEMELGPCARVYEGLSADEYDPVGRDSYLFDGFMERYDAIRSQQQHTSLQDDLKEHLWAIQGNMEV